MLERIRDLPIWALAIVTFVGVGVVRALLDLADSPRHVDWPVELVVDVLYALVLTAVVSIRIERTRRRAGGTQELAAMRRALRTGVTPDDADPRTWTPRFERDERMIRRARWINPVGFGLFVLLAVWLVLDGEVLSGVACGLLFLAFGVWTTWQAHDRLPKAHRVLATLAQRGQQWTYSAPDGEQR